MSGAADQVLGTASESMSNSEYVQGVTALFPLVSGDIAAIAGRELRLLDRWDELVLRALSEVLFAARADGKNDHEAVYSSLRDAAAILMVAASDVRFDYGIDGCRVCRKCGCTDDDACPQGCSWVEPDLCSACQEGGAS